MENLLTVAEVAKTLKVSNMTIYRMVKAGNLPAIKIGRAYRISVEVLDHFLKSSVTSTGKNSSNR